MNEITSNLHWSYWVWIFTFFCTNFNVFGQGVLPQIVLGPLNDIWHHFTSIRQNNLKARRHMAPRVLDKGLWTLYMQISRETSSTGANTFPPEAWILNWILCCARQTCELLWDQRGKMSVWDCMWMCEFCPGSAEVAPVQRHCALFSFITQGGKDKNFPPMGSWSRRWPRLPLRPPATRSSPLLKIVFASGSVCQGPTSAHQDGLSCSILSSWPSCRATWT